METKLTHVKQTKLYNCGPACIEMILGYMPEDYDLKCNNKQGTYIFQLGSYLKKTKPDMELLMSYYNPQITCNSDISKLSKDDLLDRLLRYYTPRNNAEKISYNYMIKYLKYTNGNIHVAIPTLEHIDYYLDRRYKALCLVSMNHIYDTKYADGECEFDYHFVIITKNQYLSSNYRILDPQCDSVTNVRKDKFLYGLHIMVSDEEISTGGIIFFR